MFILDPQHCWSPDLKQQQKTGVKRNLLSYLFCSYKYHIIENYFIFELEKKNLDQFTKNYSSFYAKNCHYALKNKGLGSEIRDPFPDPGSKRLRIPDPDQQHWEPGFGIQDPGFGTDLNQDAG
jgi:hypothetical protein